jgi:hypothetical protein
MKQKQIIEYVLHVHLYKNINTRFYIFYADNIYSLNSGVIIQYTNCRRYNLEQIYIYLYK